MKANELMVGDWVVYRGDTEYENPVRIEGMDIRTRALITEDREDVGFDGIDPIPLTAEILRKNGFETEDAKDGGFVLCDDFYDIFIYEWSDRIWVARYESTEMNIPFEQATIGNVHELQHFLRTSCIEKEIEL